MLEKLKIRDTSRKKLIYTGVAILLAVILVAVNLLSGLLPWSVRSAPLAHDSVFTLSAPTKSELSTLNKDVTLYLVCDDGDITYDRDLYAFLKNYESISSHISVDVLDTETDADFLSSLGIDGTGNDISFLVKSETRYRILPLADLFYYYSEEMQLKMSSPVYNATVSSYAESGVDITPYFAPYFNGEACITNAIRYVAAPSVPVIAVIDSDNSLLTLDTSFEFELVQNGCDMRFLSSVTELTDVHEILIYSTPINDLSEAEAAHLSTWLATGKNMMLTTYYNAFEKPRLASILENYGMAADERGVRITENNQSFVFKDGSDVYQIPKIAQHAATGSKFDGYVALSSAHAIYVTDDTLATPWLYTSDIAVREKSENNTWTAIDEPSARYNYGVIGQKDGSRVIWISTPYAFDYYHNDMIAVGGNYKLLLSALDWMASDSITAIETQANEMSSSTLSFTTTPLVIWTAVLVVILPLIFLSIGIIRRYVRRKA